MELREKTGEEITAGVRLMLYRRMNRTTTNLSILGFGCMRLPQNSLLV